MMFKLNKGKRLKSNQFGGIENGNGNTNRSKVNVSYSCPEKLHQLTTECEETEKILRNSTEMLLENHENMDILLTRARTLSNDAEKMKKIAQKAIFVISFV
ncbi:uncharacterized protein TRIADDRAFT_56690 [Trichoplax adhaerens]|uniref:V-SNARE coiled-coil homology domain-containing protein n=1 Tax=Trichoplax adhaerens TaxID=10228 RepID=B3RWB6_TRIAD|nr:predicted protein [Trichoplax adhaerens]EDV24668.1 predicted protein [Trichoplax adhaerens]|eukprot:XP_002112558.1 predicted protein [Trichoplax adhaerens]